MSTKNKKNSVKPEKEPGTRSSLPMRVMKYVIALVLVVVLVYFGFTAEVREGNCAVILRFGAVREEITQAGLYFRLPWPFETVVTYDNRLQYLESNFLETTTKDKRNVILQSYVIWEIGDPVLYHNSVGAQGKVDSYIKDQVFSATNSVLGAYDLTALVSLEEEELRIGEIQDQILNRLRDTCAKNYGIDVTDVSILRLSLPDTNLQAVFEQMKADRQKAIDTILANAGMEANKIVTQAESEAAAIVAGGQTAAAEIKAKTETEVARIYAESRGFTHIGCNAVLRYQVFVVQVVGYDEALKTKLAAQYVRKKLAVRRHRRAVYRAVRRHKRGNARVHRFLERGQENLAHLAHGNLRIVGVARARCLAVAEIVLSAGGNKPVPFIAAYYCRAELAYEVRVFAEGFVDSAPARIARYAEHGGEHPIKPVGVHFLCRSRTHFLYKLLVPGASRGKLGGEYRGVGAEGVAVYRVDAENRGDSRFRGFRFFAKLLELVAHYGEI